MNWVDLVIVLSLAISAGHGVMRGGAVQIVSYLGFGIGLLLGAALAPLVADLFSGDLGRSLSLTTVFGLAIGMTLVGQRSGKRLLPSIRRLNLGHADKVVGAGFGMVVTLFATWLIGAMFAPIDVPQVSRGIHSSRIMRWLFDQLPPAPPLVAGIQRFFIPEGIPPVFAELEPSPAPDVPTASPAEVQTAVNATKGRVVRIIASGCGQVRNGSGFVAAPDLVVTAAHVVVGVEKPVVRDQSGSHRAWAVYFDPNMDLAILRAGGVDGRPLRLIQEIAPRGERGAVLGFPGGGPFRARAGAVLAQFDNVLGRGIYGGNVSREVYQLKAPIRSGNSGGPFVKPSGEVLALVFSASYINPNIGYGLTSPEVARKLEVAKGRRQPVSTGSCPA